MAARSSDAVAVEVAGDQMDRIRRSEDVDRDRLERRGRPA